MRITRYPSLSEPQFLGCVSAFTDALTGELNSAAMYLRKLEGQTKGGAFAYEMSLDRHRYGVLTVLDRWSALAGAFGPHLTLSRHPAILAEAAARVHTAESILESANRLVDAADRYGSDIVEACLLAFQSLAGVFAEERQAAAQSAQLGPLLPEEFKEARGIFLQDLSAR
ncbi:MAG TPA: hypothetical protein VMR62_23810 [Bryobacteraceae bacterium]|nr:hypothetical protein [Bryobacteraceae bacterium]